MSILNKTEIFEKQGVGYVAIIRMRLPFRVFSKNGGKVLFRPAFAGSKWYELDVEKIDPEVLMNSDNAFSAMSYLRSVQEM